MAHRFNHYDLAFEQYLRNLRIPFVTVDEKRRSQLDEVSLKSMDFIVYSRHNENLLVDVKGRQFPTLGHRGGSRWENWTEEDDVTSLLHWQEVFGTDFRAMFLFAYELFHPQENIDPRLVFEFKDRRYAFFGIWVEQYQQAMKQRSPSWQTVSLPVAKFRELCQPLTSFL